MSKPWFRLYAEFIGDPKVQLLAFEDQRHFIGILCLKCNGTLDAGHKTPEHRERMIAKALGLDVATAAEVRRRLDEAQLISPDWQPLKWNSRQYESDSSTARVHRFREQQREKRFGNVAVTDKNRSEQNRKEPPKGGSFKTQSQIQEDMTLARQAAEVRKRFEAGQ